MTVQYTIDNLGNLIAPNGYPVGTYDGITQKCELYDTTEVQCPDTNNIPFEQLTVSSKPTYWYLLLIAFILAVILFAWWLNK